VVELLRYNDDTKASGLARVTEEWRWARGYSGVGPGSVTEGVVRSVLTRGAGAGIDPPAAMGYFWV